MEPALCLVDADAVSGSKGRILRLFGGLFTIWFSNEVEQSQASLMQQRVDVCL